MADQWYYAQDGQRHGPISREQLDELATSGQLQADNLVWTEGMDQWTAASQIEGLLPAAPPEPTPPLPSGPPAPAGPPPMAVGPAKIPGGRFAEMLLWRYLIIAGGGLMFLTFFTPWWGVSMDVEKMMEADSKKQEEFQRIMRNDAEWYVDHLDSTPRGKDESSERLWGWSTGTGLTGFILSFFILAIGIVPLFVKAVRPWAFFGSFAAAVMGLILFIFALTWMFGAPWKNVSPFLAQGKIIGPYFFLLACLLVLAGAVTDTVFGTMGFVARLKKKGS
ncbi:MAG TPA: DUF4339 domain-containing protein [Thermoguttaceae bacterium]|nr:DUF4339 domain-containing protein [Thermoguttaceae bacterium]